MARKIPVINQVGCRHGVEGDCATCEAADYEQEMIDKEGEPMSKATYIADLEKENERLQNVLESIAKHSPPQESSTWVEEYHCLKFLAKTGLNK